MSVWVVAFDESEEGGDPLLRVFAQGLDALWAIKQMAAASSFNAKVRRDVDEAGSDFTLNYFDPEEGERLSISMWECRIEQPSEVKAEGVL